MIPNLAHPEWAAALAILSALAAAAVIASAVHARRRLRRLLGPAGAADRRAERTDAFLLAALVAIAVALLGPRIGTATRRVPDAGIDLAILTDVSLSMDARDVPPSRLARAREAGDLVLRSLEPGDQAALAAFAGRGILLTPLTPDRGALAEILPAVETSLFSDQGSELASGIEAALGAFDLASPRPRVLLILSDGEVSHRSLGESIGKARRAGVRVVAAALGSEAGGPIPVRGDLLRDGSGETVVTHRETEHLALLADRTGGVLLRADRWGAVEIAAVVEGIRRGASHDGWIEQRALVTRFGAFAALALALLLLEGLPSLPRRARGGAAAALLLFSVLEPRARAEPLEALEAEVRKRPEDAGALLHLGAARALAGARDEAKRAFLAAAVRARDDRTAALAYYDLGVVALEERDLESARDAFFDAIALAPGDKMAKFNLEWTLRALERAPPLPPAGRERARPPRRKGQAEPSEEQRDEESAPAAQGEPARGASAARTSETRAPPPELDPEQARRWLEGVQDDPRRALQSLAGAAESQSRRGPRW